MKGYDYTVKKDIDASIINKDYSSFVKAMNIILESKVNDTICEAVQNIDMIHNSRPNK